MSETWITGAQDVVCERSYDGLLTAAWNGSPVVFHCTLTHFQWNHVCLVCFTNVYILRPMLYELNVPFNCTKVGMHISVYSVIYQ